MISTSSSTAPEVLKHRVHSLFIQAWLRLALYGMSLLLGVAAISVTLMAFVDVSTRTERFWLGGSFVWCSVALTGFWFVSYIQSWPTYFHVARKWEGEYPFLGEAVSSAVGFLCEERTQSSLSLLSSSEAVNSREPAPVSSSEMKVLALEYAARVSSGVPCVHLKSLFRALACFVMSCLVAFSVYFLGDVVWRQAVRRQVPPAVGGWSKLRPNLAFKRSARQTALSAAEIPVVSQVLLERYEEILEHLGRDAGQSLEEYRAVVAETMSLAGRVDAEAEALLLRWFASQISASTGDLHLEDILNRLVIGGRAALSFSQATAMRIYLNEQLFHIFSQQAGLRPDELGSVRILWLERLAESDEKVSSVVDESYRVLCDEGIVGDAPISFLDERTSLLILQNRLGRAIGKMDSFIRDCSKVVHELGLTVSNVPIMMKWDDSPKLARAMVGITTVEADIAKTQDVSEVRDVVGVNGVQVVSSPAVRSVSDRPGSDGVASGGTKGGSSGGISNVLPVVSLGTSGLGEGRLWALWSPLRDTGRRGFVDQTTAGGEFKAFQRYVDQVTVGSKIGSPSLMRQQK